MNFSRLLILAAAAWAGTWVYKLQHVPVDPNSDGSSGNSSESSSDSSSGHSFFSDIYGSGSLARTVRSSTNNRNTNPPYANNKPVTKGNGKPGLTQPVEDLAPDDMGLLMASAKGDKNLVERRLSMHVKADSRDTLRRTPLMYASWNGNDDIANRLIAAGAHPELKDRIGNDAFDYAASRGLTDSLHFLLQRTHTQDTQHYMEYALIMQATYSGNPARLPEGTDRLAAINHINPEGQAPLHIAAGNGSIALMQAMLHRGAQVDITNDSRQTPLHWAAWNNRPQAVQLLLNQGADISASDYSGNTPLILAAQNNGAAAAQVLLARGADRYASNKDGKTAAIIAEDSGFTSLAELLK